MGNLVISSGTTGIKSNQATLTATITGADDDQPVGIGFYDDSDDSVINTVTHLTGLDGSVFVDVLDDTAMIMVDGQDLAAYAGSDSGNTPYMLMAKDTSGRVMASFCGAVGAGQAVGSNLISGFVNSSNGPLSTFVTDGLDITSAIDADASCRFGSSTTASLTEGGIYFFDLPYTGSIGISFYFGFSDVSPSFSGVLGILDSFYINSDRTAAVYLLFYMAGGCNFSAPGCGLYRLTDVPATGLHLIDSIDGNQRGIAHIDTNFDTLHIDEIYLFSHFVSGDNSTNIIWSGLTAATGYAWYPTANNGVQITTGGTENFTTNTKPYSSDISPANGTSYAAGTTSVTLSAVFNDDDGGSGSLRFYDADDDSLIGTASGVADGGAGQISWTGLAAGQHNFYVIPNDGTEDGAASATISFTIAAGGEIITVSNRVGPSVSRRVGRQVSTLVGERTSNKIIKA